MKKTAVFYFIFFVSLVYAQQIDSLALKYASYISIDDLKRNLNVIASDEYEGRETGKRGQKMTATYLADEFKKTGVKHSYQQYNIKEKQAGKIRFYIDKIEKENNKEYFFFPADINKKKIKIKELIFLGYGIDDSVYNDYKGISVYNKAVMFFSGEPLNNDSVSIITLKKNYIYWNDRLKIKKAEDKGANFILIVKPNIEKEAEKQKPRIESASMILKNGKQKPTVIYISEQMAQETISSNKRVQEWVQTKNTQSTSLREEVVQVNIKVRKKKPDKYLTSENVIGFIEGEKRKEEVVVISAHYDHLGIKHGKVFNGADDDGSGTVALLELAKAFSEAKKQGNGPQRSIMIIAFSGEEKGLLGSSYYVEHPYVAIKQTVCNLNIDMIGRIDENHSKSPNYIYLIGSDKLSTQLHQISETTNATYTQLELDYTYNDEKDKNRFYYRSDHYNFAKKGVPVIFYFNGVHEDYHQPTDVVEKIEFELLKNRCLLVFYTAWELANREQRIVVDK